ncbi:MAG TPA: hypothetical protein VIG88_08405, partial [Lysobacter sp.]
AAALRESAAARGDAVAQNAMGVHYQREGDRTTAAMWYRRAIDGGSAAARLNLAALERAEDDRQAAQGLQAAAAKGDAGALFTLARRYHRGDGATVDYARALRYYRAAAAKGHAGARRMLGLIQSRPAADGGLDVAWMRQLAAIDNGGTGGIAVSTPSLSARLDDPLAGLPGLPGLPGRPGRRADAP